MSDIKIDKNIPIPNKRQRAEYPFESMKVGDSFLAQKGEVLLVRQAASQWKRRHEGWEYITRSEENGLRLWRIS